MDKLTLDPTAAEKALESGRAFYKKGDLIQGMHPCIAQIPINASSYCSEKSRERFEYYKLLLYLRQAVSPDIPNTRSELPNPTRWPLLAKSSFKEASRLSPKDAVSLSNLSAVEFELGNYVGCSLFSQKALALLEVQENKQAAMQQKVLMRLAKAYLHLRKIDEAASILSKISLGEARNALERSVSAIQRLQKTCPDEKASRKLLLDRISRYRPYL